jgi:hypothetical protein
MCGLLFVARRALLGSENISHDRSPEARAARVSDVGYNIEHSPREADSRSASHEIPRPVRIRR